MAIPGITPTARMRKKPKTRQYSQRSMVIHVSGQEQDYPVYNFSGRRFLEKPNKPYNV